MRRGLHLLLGCALLAGLVGASAASAQPTDQPTRQTGLQVTVHTHSNIDPIWTGLMFETDRLSFNFVEGENFAYSSRPCSGQALFNDLGLDFIPDLSGVDDDADGTAPVRHLVQGVVTDVNRTTGTIEGTITTVLCETRDGQQVRSESEIVSYFEARYRRVSNNEILLVGTFEISPTESTGIFEGLEGQGSIQGVLTCLAHQRDPSQPTCAERGHFTDFVGARGDLTEGPGEIGPGLRGTVRLPT